MTAPTTTRFQWMVLQARQLLTGATGILILTTVATLFVRVISSVTLTRLLTPDIFGLVGIITSIFVTIALLTDLGFQAHVVRHPSGDDVHFQDVIWTIHAVRGVGLAALGMIASPLVGWALGKPEITLPLCVASLTFAIDGSASLALISALRTNGSKTLSIFDLAVTVVQIALSVALAALFRNVWGLIVSMVVGSLFRTAASYLLVGRRWHTFVKDRLIAAEFWQFSRLIMASSFLTLLIGQADKFTFARMLSLGEFGLYTTAVSLATAPQAVATSYVARILYPAYAAAWQKAPDALSSIYYSAGKRMHKLYWLGGGFLIGGAPLIIKILYDPRYMGAATYLSLLACSTLLTLSNKASTNLLLATGNVKFNLHTNIVRLCWIIAATPLLYLAMGKIGIVMSFGLVEVPVYLFCSLVLHNRHIYRIGHELVFFVLAAVGGLSAVALSSFVAHFLPQVT